jgi:hypothetical protein
MKAFPNVTNEKGMDLRDYFAAKAMQAMIQNSTSLKDDETSQFNTFYDYSFDNAIISGVSSEIDLTDGDRDIKYTWAQYYAEEAYCIADAMMKARENRD